MKSVVLTVVMAVLIFGSVSLVPRQLPVEAIVPTGECFVCDSAVWALCDIVYDVEYNICMITPGTTPTQCRERAASKWVDCLKGAGCLDPVKLPPDN